MHRKDHPEEQIPAQGAPKFPQGNLSTYWLVMMRGGRLIKGSATTEYSLAAQIGFSFILGREFSRTKKAVWTARLDRVRVGRHIVLTVSLASS